MQMFFCRFPRWLSGKESTCQCRRHGFNPWSGKTPLATEQLSPCAATADPHAATTEALAARSPGSAVRSPCDEKPTFRSTAQPRQPGKAACRGEALAQPATAQNNPSLLRTHSCVS